MQLHSKSTHSTFRTLYLQYIQATLTLSIPQPSHLDFLTIPPYNQVPPPGVSGKSGGGVSLVVGPCRMGPSLLTPSTPSTIPYHTHTIPIPIPQLHHPSIPPIHTIPYHTTPHHASHPYHTPSPTETPHLPSPISHLPSPISHLPSHSPSPFFFSPNPAFPPFPIASLSFLFFLSFFLSFFPHPWVLLPLFTFYSSHSLFFFFLFRRCWGNHTSRLITKLCGRGR